jgi:hypothetical protein
LGERAFCSAGTERESARRLPVERGPRTRLFRLAEPFRTSGYVFETAELLVATLDDGTHRGLGEAAGVYYLGDDLAHMRAVIEESRTSIEANPSREALRAILPPGAAPRGCQWYAKPAS